MITLPRRVCLFAEHHRGERVPATTIRTIEALAQAGFEVHAALSGSMIDESDRSILGRIGVRAKGRPNAGLDFGAWQELVRDGAAEGADEVLLANDSVFGPFAPLEPILRAMEGFDAWGMVESREGRPHLQSWFVWMSGEAFRSRAVGRVFEQPFPMMSKPEIITHGELGLAAAFEAEGLDVGARYSARFRLRPSALVATNPMHFRWRDLMSSGLVPFVKIELLRDNPAGIIGIDAWERTVGALDGADLDAMRARLADSRRGDGRRSPASAGWRQSILQLAIREDRGRVLRERLAARLGR